ncbi:hypothetical protein HPC49_05700 [Pyxidicoccus fallax]|uniref:Lipoprotein n=1 Tax=Pyxidicoccus fallax TaxID=394095 RepID=A0A848L5Q2_9BACT|nr:hypothetical protein [Pyxidicoccus fallax]NMO13602.1 hypothetical protein [Pyxidicoccus fallax]NPC77746.1 hypothetical protein [Pyxidicoccus fallax]
MRFVRFGFAAVACFGALVLTGCPDKPAATTDAGAPGTTAQAPTTPPPARFSLSYQAPDAGLAEISLAPDEKPAIEATSVLELRSSIGLRNYRVRLFDEAERAMVSDDDVEESDSGLVYRINLPQPLKTGFEYTLVVDAQTGSAFTDSLGREVEELRTTFQIAGEKEKPAPPPPAKKRKK